MAFLSNLLIACQNSLFDTFMAMARWQAGLKTSRITVDNIQYALLQGGNPEGQTILMIHGFGADKDNWLYLSRHLKNSYRIICVDMPGHGESSQTANMLDEPLDYLITEQATRLHNLLKTLATDKVHIMGNSMGGAIALLFAAMYPDQLHSVTLLNNAGIDAPDQSELFQRLDQGENPLIAREQGDYNRLIDFVMSKKPFMPWPLAVVMERKAIARAELNQTIFRDMLRSRDEFGSPEQIAAGLASITVPVLAIWGNEDRVLDVSSITVMQKHIPEMKSVVFPGVGHLPMLEIPGSVAAEFDRFATHL